MVKNTRFQVSKQVSHDTNLEVNDSLLAVECEDPMEGELEN